MQTLLVAASELRRRVRNRSAIVTAVVGPLALAVVFGLLVSGTGSVTFTVGVVDLDGSHLSRTVTSGLLEQGAGETADDGQGAVDFERVDTLAAARLGVDDGDLDGAIVVPAGFGASVEKGRPSPLTVVRSGNRLVGGQVATSVGLGIEAELDRVALALRTAAARSGSRPDAGLVAAARAQPAAIVVTDLPPGEGEISTAAFYGAAMSILFLFFTVGFAARSLLVERREGTLGRMLASGATPRAILTGKTLAVALLGLTGFVTVWVVTSVAFDADWGDPAAVALLIVATVFAIGGVTLFVASFARTDQQAEAYTLVVTFAFALLGGNFVGPFAPELLRTLSLATPNGWALRAFTDLGADAASLATILPALGVLVGIGALFGWIGMHRAVRAVVS
ncbi:MAG: ABC transporter permease [Gaiellales bacterium]